MIQNDLIQGFKTDFFGSSFKLAFRALLATAFILILISILWLLVSAPASYFFATWIDQGMLIINEQPDFSGIDTNAGPWAILSELFTFEFSEDGIYTLILASIWLFITYLFFIGYTTQVIFKILNAKAQEQPMRLFQFLRSSLNGMSLKIALLIGVISLITYIPVLAVQSIAPGSLLLAFVANLIYYLLLIKFIISPAALVISDINSIPKSLAYSWNHVSWSSALKILVFSFGFIMLIFVLFFFATLVFTGTSIAVPRFALPSFLFFLLMGVYLFTLGFSAQYGLYMRYLPVDEPKEEFTAYEEVEEDAEEDEFYFPEYDDEKDDNEDANKRE